MKIIVADQRLTEPRGVKALIVGPTGVGKTRTYLKIADCCRSDNNVE
jgi:flagellar biosynthesis GTPase FlhF